MDTRTLAMLGLGAVGVAVLLGTSTGEKVKTGLSAAIGQPGIRITMGGGAGAAPSTTTSDQIDTVMETPVMLPPMPPVVLPIIEPTPTPAPSGGGGGISYTAARALTVGAGAVTGAGVGGVTVAASPQPLSLGLGTMLGAAFGAVSGYTAFGKWRR